MQILVVLSKNKKTCKFRICRFYKGLENLIIKFLNLKVNAEGFEPSTACLEGRCSIQLSYASIYFKTLSLKVLVGVAGFEPAASCSQSRRDNRATLHPEAKSSGETGTRTLATVTRRQISNLLHYRSGTSPSSRNVFCFAVAKVTQHYISHNYFDAFFYIFFDFFLKHLTIKHIELTKN